MSTKLSDFISGVQTYIRDKTNGFVSESDLMFSANLGIKYLKAKTGIQASKNRSEIDIFPNVYEYKIPTDFQDLITIQERGKPINFYRKSPDEFWLRLNSGSKMLAVDSLLGDKFLLCHYSSAGSDAILNDCDSLTSNGTWSVTGDATNLTLDEVNNITGSGALNFDITVSGTSAGVENSGITSIDLSDEENGGTLFFSARIPDVTNITGFTAKWGSSSSDYWENTTTEQFSGLSLADGKMS